MSAGTRRITALTGREGGRARRKDRRRALGEAAKLLGVSPLDVPDGGRPRSMARARELRKQLAGGGGGRRKPQAASQSAVERGEAERTSR